MEYKINDSLTINIKDYKPYGVTKAVKMAMMSWITVNPSMDIDNFEFPAENSIKAEEALILWMTDITQEILDDLREEEYEWLLKKINEVATVPKSES